MFSNLTKLDHLKLYDSCVHTIQVNSFQDLTSLTTLELHGNQLNATNVHTFQHLANLQELTLDNNLIVSVGAASFSHLTSLTKLTLNDNFLTTLSEMIFDINNPPSALHDFHIYNNPLVCDDKVSWIMAADGAWLTVQSPELIQCSGPPSLASLTWDKLTPDNLTQASLCEYGLYKRGGC